MISARVGYAYRRRYVTSISRAEEFANSDHRGRGSGPRLLWEGLDKFRHIVSTALYVRMHCSMIHLYKAVELLITRL